MCNGIADKSTKSSLILFWNLSTEEVKKKKAFIFSDNLCSSGIVTNKVHFKHLLCLMFTLYSRNMTVYTPRHVH